MCYIHNIYVLITYIYTLCFNYIYIHMYISFDYISTMFTSLGRFFCRQELPSYARPRFLRFLSDMDVTGTFKHQKAMAERTSCRGVVACRGVEENFLQSNNVDSAFLVFVYIYIWDDTSHQLYIYMLYIYTYVKYFFVFYIYIYVFMHFTYGNYFKNNERKIPYPKIDDI